jgi:hypothetical protein
VQKGPKNALPDGTRYEYDPILKRIVEITPSRERFPVMLVDATFTATPKKRISGRGRPPSGKFRRWRGRRPSPRVRGLGLSHEQFTGGINRRQCLRRKKNRGSVSSDGARWKTCASE